MNDQLAGVEMRHDLHKFFDQAADEIAAEYQRIYANSSSDPGSAGDEGERNWAALLKAWLPPSYHVVTKGRLINHRGEISPQIDVVVLKPSYPLRLREKAIWLSGGVAAVFECKNTLKSEDIKASVSRSIKFKNLVTPELGSPRREMKSPIFYGLLSHSHAWKGENSSPAETVRKALESESLGVEHPRLLIDVICVADLGLWKYNFIPAYQLGWLLDNRAAFNAGSYELAMTMFVESTVAAHREKSVSFQPIGGLISTLMQDLAWGDTSIRDIANYYRLVQLPGMGHGSMRPWPVQAVYSPSVVTRVRSGPFSNELWDEWSLTSGVL